MNLWPKTKKRNPRQKMWVKVSAIAGLYINWYSQGSLYRTFLLQNPSFNLNEIRELLVA
jgi:hypothetical protein